MLKQIIEINDLVNLWDLNQDRRNEKIKILKQWEKELNQREFQTLLKICHKFNYYSESLAAEAYKNIFEDQASKRNNFNEFLQNSLFFPLRRKGRIESSIDMLSSFRLVNEIDANNIKVECVSEFLEKYKTNFEYTRDKVVENDSTVKELEKSIYVLRENLKIHSDNNRVRDKIEKRISKLEEDRKYRIDDSESLGEIFYEEFLSVQNLIIIDDFIGTGDSVIKFLKKINNVISGSKIDINLFLWVIEASKSGLEAIEEKAIDLNINIQVSYYKESINVLAEEIVFSNEEIDDVKKLIRNINEYYRLTQSGYSMNHAIASFVNAPNNNLTLLSEESSTWTPLFLRTKRNKKKRKFSKTEMKDTLNFIRH
ncbi:hypothetical protein [Pontibacillus yanchengensis]|uniref:PRTase-CE domain-containing protein n=1 Tax=Pontibacillus yanchengensis Y32 TaxID=1385514 RepID=A0A0A2TKA6_9BACI|nr:hypothetical protein [Pontibacillus yanchengensis]KGP74521.1 hypothetical protein N782_12715 [Pontibacillus yanchengensis Y32]